MALKRMVKARQAAPAEIPAMGRISLTQEQAYWLLDALGSYRDPARRDEALARAGLPSADGLRQLAYDD